jgi:hypothetical protein
MECMEMPGPPLNHERSCMHKRGRVLHAHFN